MPLPRTRRAPLARLLSLTAAATAAALPLTLGSHAGAVGTARPEPTVAEVPAGLARAAEGESPLVLWAPSKIETTAYRGRVYTGFGVRLVAPTAPVEIRAHRPSYDEEIAATWLSPDGEKALPAGSMTDFSGLDDLIEVELTAKGTTRRLTLDGCLGGYAQRIRPDAPARNPYPWGCPYNPFTVGSVMGLEAGYAAAPIDEWSNRLRIKPGKYDVTVRIAPAYASFFGISSDDATQQLRLVVVDEGRGDSGPGVGRRADGTPLQPASPAPAGPGAEPADDGPRPDLRSLPAWDIGLNGKGTVIRFAATVWNAGDSPLVVDGFRAEDEDHMAAYQYFFDASGEQTGYQEVGEMHWHAENHQHWHFEDFAQYRLLGEDQREVVLSGKQSFCLANTDAVDYTVPGADWHPENTDLSTACGGFDAISVRQVLSAGSGDTYHQFRYGQAFGIKNVPDGVYYIAVQANPMRNLVESDVTNNDALRKIELRTTKRGERRLKVHRVGVVEDQLPDWMRRAITR
ncbi:lysyl oxidase family protein [Nocardioides ferulae]|uniref:lysyl oxidase family protein n=1 Tax=Nocardioides ferulae TaxID=2340821 RepID=UPI000EB31BA2|nr:lysyl oxidase family protein [Nocardioides ferulae]